MDLAVMRGVGSWGWGFHSQKIQNIPKSFDKICLLEINIKIFISSFSYMLYKFTFLHN